MTDGDDTQVIVGRGLRSLVQYRNKKLSEFSRLLSKCKKGSRRTNQMNSGNPLPQLLEYIKYKGKVRGVKLEKISEEYTTQTCPKCGHRHKPSGRIYQCKNPDCDFIGIRDSVGAANIKNKFENDTIKPNHILPPDKAKYRRPVKVPVIKPTCAVPLTLGTLLDNTLDKDQGLSSAEGNTSSGLFHAA